MLSKNRHSKLNIAIVLNLDSNGLGVMRSLGRLGIEVHGIDYKKNAVGLSSKYCKKKYIFSSPILKRKECLTELIELGKSFNLKPVLIPSADYYVTLISEYQKELSKYYLFNIPEPEVLASIVDKRKQYKCAEELRILTAKTFYPKSFDEIRNSDFKFPVFIKGVSGYKWASVFNNKGFVTNNQDELEKYYMSADNENVETIIQEIITGPNKNHFKVCAYYNKKRELLAIFSTQKTRQFPVDFGVGSYMISGHYPELIKEARNFFEGIKYTGIGSIEFKKDDMDGKYKLIELNPRLWQQNIQATYAGINFAYINYLDCIGEDVKPILDFKDDIRWLDAIQDFQSFLGNNKKGDVKFYEWIKSVFKTDCCAYFALDDVKPGLENSHYFTKYLKLPLKILR